MTLWLRLAMVMAFFVSAYPAQAVVTVYTSEAEFKSAMVGLTHYDAKDHIAPYKNPFPDKEYVEINKGKFAFGPVLLSSELLTLYFDNGIYFGGGYDKEFAISGTGTALGLMLDATYGDFTMTYSVDGGPTGTIDFGFGPDVPQFLGFVSDRPGVKVTLFGPGEIDVRGALANGPNALVPEPAAWAMMVLGFGLAGVALRRRGARLAYA